MKMIKILILTSLAAVIDTTLIPSHMLNYPHGLENLFGTKREVSVEKEKKQRSLCESQECKLIANVIKDSMDESIDPCDDFYEYACGKWSNMNPTPENRTTWSLWDMVQEKIEKQVQGIIETEPKPDSLFAVKLAHKWYKSCMDEEAIERSGVEPLLSTLWRHGGWPLIMEEGEWDDRIYNWQIVDDQFARLFGSNALHDVMYGPISFEGNSTIIITPPHLPPHMYTLLSIGAYYSTSDSSNEDNESGEGSQERGSKEKGKTKNEDDENDEDEENSEDNEVEDNENNEEDGEEDGDEEQLRKKKVARRKSRKRLGQSRRNSNGNKGTRKRIGDGQTRKRTKRDIMKAKVLRSMLKLKKHAKHRTHHSAKKTKGILSKQERQSVDRNNKKNKAIEKHNHEGKMKNKSKSTSVKTRDHNSKHHERRKIDNHRVRHRIDNHRVHRKIDNHRARKTKVSEREDNEISSSTNDVENEDSNDNEVDNENNDEDNGNVSNDNDGNTEGQDNGSADEDDNEDNDEEEDSNDEDDEGEYDYDDYEYEDEDEEEREKLREEYKDFIFNVSLILSKARGIEVPREKLKKDVADLVEFEINLGELTLVSMEAEETTIDDFQEECNSLNSTTSNSKVNWKRKVQKVLDEAGIEMDGNVELIIFPRYFRKLHSLLDKTPKETIVNYIHWLFVSIMAQLTTNELRELGENWYGKSFYESREEQCIQQSEMSEIIAYEYVRRHLSEETVKTARDMIDDIQKEVEYQIKEATWMDEDTEHFILDKLVNMEHLVGYPDWYRNTTLVKRYFQGLTIGPSYYENIINYIRYLKWKELRESMEEDMPLQMDPLELNAFFMPSENSIALTAADFQSPFFAPNRPWNVNYGIIGVVMGHEVNHGFDDSGHLYDRNGSPMEWLSAMAAAYDQRALCFVNQFNKYSLVKGKNVTIEDYGNQTAGENIADTMGLQAVFRAYQRRERECARPDPALPGLEKFSNEQTFFLSFANIWCEAEDPEATAKSAKYDEHSPGRLRVIGSVSNSEDFAKAFNCPVGSPMNPEEKCNIWI